MTAYYNENDPKAAAWLRELIFWGMIADGEVDTRSIEDVTPNDLRGFTQCHFFAGIGGWSLALRLAGWADTEPVWTGSCPCQPFSAAGQGKRFSDERHLWPAWFHLIRFVRPQRIFGEQVANALDWLDLVSSDLEDENYAIGAAIIGAHSVGAPHIRQRLYWVAHGGGGAGLEIEREQQARRQCQAAERSGAARELGNPGGGGGGRHTGALSGTQGSAGWRMRSEFDESQFAGSLGDSCAQRQQQHTQFDCESYSWTIASPWADACRSSDLVWCRDGKWRPIEPGTFPLAHGVSGRVGLLRGYGNAIVPQVAAVFIRAYLDSI